MKRGEFYVKNLPNIYKYNIDTFYAQVEFETMRKSGNTAMYFIQQEQKYIGNPKQKERIYYSHGRKPEYDKSGCNLTEKRDNLNRKLTKYKAEKRAKEAAEVDYRQDIIAILNSFTELKAEIITCLAEAKTSSDYEKLNNATNYNLTRLVRKIEKVKKYAENKCFTSVDSASNMIEDVRTEITRLRSKLT